MNSKDVLIWAEARKKTANHPGVVDILNEISDMAMESHPDELFISLVDKMMEPDAWPTPLGFDELSMRRSNYKGGWDACIDAIKRHRIASYGALRERNEG